MPNILFAIHVIVTLKISLVYLQMKLYVDKDVCCYHVIILYIGLICITHILD